jgi:hypothetical protein
MLSRKEASAQMRRLSLFLLAIGVAGCGKHGDAGEAVAKAPSHSGDVWETDKASDRKEAPATVLAFVNGLHTVVLDGSDIYAGTTRFGTSADTGGGRVVALSNGLSARIIPAGDALELRFSTGESVPLRKQSRKGK